MKIESEHLSIELEPELMNDEQLTRVERLLHMVLGYEDAKYERDSGFEEEEDEGTP